MGEMQACLGIQGAKSELLTRDLSAQPGTGGSRVHSAHRPLPASSSSPILEESSCLSAFITLPSSSDLKVLEERTSSDSHLGAKMANLLPLSDSSGLAVAAWTARWAGPQVAVGGRCGATPNTGSAGDTCALPCQLAQLQAPPPGPGEFYHWALVALLKPCSDSSQRSSPPPVGPSPVPCALVDIILATRPLSHSLQVAAHAISPGTQGTGKTATPRSGPTQAPPASPHLLSLPERQTGGSPLPLVGHKIGHILGVARPWEPCQVHTEVPGEQRHVLRRSQMGPPCGRERGPDAWSSWLLLTWPIWS